MHGQKSEHILDTCSRLLDECDFNLSPQSQIQEFFQSHSGFTRQDEKLISEIIYGCFDNKSIIGVLVDGFYMKVGKNYLKSERSLFQVVAYIVLYRVTTNGIEELDVLNGLPKIEKVYKFLKYFLNEKSLLTWIKDAWSNHFEFDYVEFNLINPLLNILPQLNECLQELENHLYVIDPIKNKIPATDFKPFNLTQPSRKVLLPEMLSNKEVINKSKNISKSTISVNKPLQKNSAPPTMVNKERNQQIDNKPILKVNSFDRNYVKNEKKKLSQSAKESEVDLKTKQFKAQPFNITQNINEPIKINTAVVIKDEYLIKKQANELIKKLESLESGEGNPSEFLRWQEAMREQDIKKKQEEIELRKLQAKLCHEEAILAKANLVETKKQMAKRFLEEKGKIMSEKSELIKKEAEKKANLVKEINEDEKKVKNAKAQIEAEKKQMVQQLIKESEEMASQALKDTEIEMKKKIELIQQIKAAESLNSINKKKFVDLTSNAGHGLLLEMSIIELRERLEMLKQQNDEESKRKHDLIVKSKFQREQEIVDKLNYINKFRNENLSLKRIESSSSILDKAKIDTSHLKTNESILALQNKLNILKQERDNTKRPVSMSNESKKFNIYLNQRKTLEKDRFKDLEKTHERYRMLNHTENIST